MPLGDLIALIALFAQYFFESARGRPAAVAALSSGPGPITRTKDLNGKETAKPEASREKLN